MTTDDQFDAVFRAFANYNRKRAARLTPEQRAAAEKERKRNDPKHRAALKRRRKRKKGGPK